MTRHASQLLIARFGAFLDAAPDAMLVVNRQGQILAANGHVYRLFGYRPDELMGEAVEILVPPGYRGRHVAHRDRYMADPHPRPMGIELDLHGVRKDGREFPVEISLSPLQSDDGDLTVAAIRDVSERRRIESKFRGLLEAAPDAMIVADRDGRIRLVNGQTERVFGYQREELLDQSIDILVPLRFAAIHPRHRDAYVRDPQPRPMGAELDLYARRKDGTEFPVEISLSPLETEDGILITSAVRDITDRKRLEENVRQKNQELEEQNRRVEAASRLKSEFLANMSHELRTPLNSIIGFAQMMQDKQLGPIAENHREYLGDILTSARHLLHLINDILDLSKVESGTMAFYAEPVHLDTLITEVCDGLHPLAASKNIRIATDVDPAILQVEVDPGKLKQVLFNYVSNALKFTPGGGRIDIRAVAQDARHFRVEVEDTGVGIAAEDVPRLFVAFQQLDAGAAKKYQGTGLGLALTRRIVEAQGGTVGASSRPGQGSVFHAVLPRQAGGDSTERAELQPTPQTASVGSEILVIDDDIAALRLVDAALRQQGYRPTATSDPESALSVAAEHTPDLVIVDFLLRGMTGQAWLERFRALPNTTSVPVIVWTVKDLSSAERHALRVLAQAIVEKRAGNLSGLLHQVGLFVSAPMSGGPITSGRHHPDYR
jgi:PAS domain S-box-containing protein